MLTIHEREVGQYSRKSLDLEARRAASSTARAKGFSSGKVEFWVIYPTVGGITLKVQVTATDASGRWEQYATAVAL